MSNLLSTVPPLPDWKSELSRSVTSIGELLELLGLKNTQLGASQRAAEDFPLRVPRAFVSRMEPGNPQDPLLAQVLPIDSELRSPDAFTADPLNESAHNPVPGVVHKYRNRLLLIVSPACAINCRYCFRRHFPYEENKRSKQQWQQALAYIREDSSINEVIYSGGDPLAANDHFLTWLTECIADIAHVKRLRVHSRLPVVLPARVDTELLNWMTSTRLKPVVVIHSNHANEIDSSVARAVQKFLDRGLTVLNQSVLLRGVNDSALALEQLSEGLFDIGVLPYYLHLLDPVKGASHFHVEDEVALEIYRELQACLPGYLLPRLVREQSGETSKTLLAP
jgi:L-lysine 2,3-aminomutase